MALPLAILILGMAGWGWWLAALSVPPAGIVIAGLLVVYGLGVGWGSVVPASAVISVAIALLVAFDIFPAFWPANIHYKYWAYTVLVLWGGSVAAVCLLAKIGQTLRQRPGVYRWGVQLVLATGLLLALQTGASLYQNHWPGWVPWEHL